MPNKDELSADARGLLDQMILEAYGDLFPEDPLPRPTITVEEAFNMGLVAAGVDLRVEWQGPYDPEYYPPRRRVSYIHRNYQRDDGSWTYDVQARELGNTCDGNEHLYLPLDTIEDHLWYANWLEKRKKLLDAEDRIADLEYELAHLKEHHPGNADPYCPYCRNEEGWIVQPKDEPGDDLRDGEIPF